MAVGPNITLPDPAIIGARLGGTVSVMSVDRSWAPARGDDAGRRDQRWLIDGILVLLTGCAVRLVSQAGKGLVRFWRSLGPLNWRMRCRWSTLPPPISVHSQPEQRE